MASGNTVRSAGRVPIAVNEKPVWVNNLAKKGLPVVKKVILVKAQAAIIKELGTLTGLVCL